MEKRTIFSLILLFSLLISSCQLSGTRISADNPNLHYIGRVGTNNDGTKEIYWSGSSVTINFEGTTLNATLKDENAENYFNVIIDNDSVYILNPSDRKKTYSIIEGLEAGKHSVEIYKRTEWTKGKTIFYEFSLPDGKILEAGSLKKRKIEFYGNSITCGYAIEDFSNNDSPEGTFTNHYLTYAALTARYFDAEMTCISQSGIGIMVSWFPSIMYDIYDKLNPADSTSLWDFSKNTPQLVVVNIFQNDSWLVNRPDHPSFEKYFGTQPPSEVDIIAAYKDFISSIRNKYTDANILCILGSMDITKEGSDWPDYVQRAVNELNDENIYTYFLPYKNTPGHPRVNEQKWMADSLIVFIEDNIFW